MTRNIIVIYFIFTADNFLKLILLILNEKNIELPVLNRIIRRKIQLKENK